MEVDRVLDVSTGVDQATGAVRFDYFYDEISSDKNLLRRTCYGHRQNIVKAEHSCSCSNLLPLFICDIEIVVKCFKI